MTTFDAFDKLTCSVCMELYRSPRLLPCHHTFCEVCLQQITSKHGGSSFPCPNCRKVTSVPEGGVANFQTNFYILDDLEKARKEVELQVLDNNSLCNTHPGERLRFFCGRCDCTMCLQCKLTKHEGHETVCLENEVPSSAPSSLELETREELISECHRQLQLSMQKLQEKKQAVEEKRQSLELQVQARANLLTMWVNKARDAALASLDTVAKDVRSALDGETFRLDAKLKSTERFLQQLRKRLGPPTGTDNLQDNGDLDFKSEKLLEWLTSDPALPSEMPMLYHKDNCVQRDAVNRFVGNIERGFSVNIRLAFSCHDSPKAEVWALCPLENERVWVARSANGEGPGKIALYAKDGTVVRDDTITDTITGPVCITKVKDDWVKVEGRNIVKRYMSPQTSLYAKVQDKQYALHSKFRVRFEILVSDTSACEFRSVKVKDKLAAPGTESQKVGLISVKNPSAMDVSSDGRFVAVLEKDLNCIQLYVLGKREPDATYNVESGMFKPRDVCFYVLDGRECLVVADDYGNGSLHVLQVENGCSLLGRLGSDCPLLIKPTALTADDAGRLWIGCLGGQVLVLQQKECGSEECEYASFNVDVKFREGEYSIRREVLRG